MIEEFLATKRSSSTRRAYELVLVRLRDWLTGFDLDWVDLTPALFEVFLDAQNWSVASRHQATYAMRSFIRWAYGDDHVALLAVSKAPPVKPQRVLTLDQVNKLLASIDTSTVAGRRDLAIVTLMLDTGLRATEVCNLSLRYLSLNKLEAQALTKGNKWRRMVFSTYTASCIRAWLAVRNETVIALWDEGRIDAAPDTLFMSLSECSMCRPLTPGGLRYILGAVADRAEIGPLSPHDLRRTFAMLMLLNGASTRVLQVAGGWSSLHSVECYTMGLGIQDVRPWLPVGKLMAGMAG